MSPLSTPILFVFSVCEFGVLRQFYDTMVRINLEQSRNEAFISNVISQTKIKRLISITSKNIVPCQIRSTYTIIIPNKNFTVSSLVRLHKKTSAGVVLLSMISVPMVT